MSQTRSRGEDTGVITGRGSGRRDRATRRHITGVLVLDKSIGMTSNGALQAARRIFRAKKAGHTGSLDPLASGVLPICFGEATKLSGWLLDARKTYEVTARLGERTDTADSTGVVIEIHDVPSLGRDQVSAALEGFLGPIEQVPPMFSALKQGGRRLYELARKGETVDRPPRKVTIHEIELLDLDDKELRFRVCCSKGTYVRTLVEDLAAELGTVGHVAALRRTVSGPFDIASAVTLEQLESDATSATMDLNARLLPADSAVPDLPAVSLEPGEVDRIRCGQRIARSAAGVEGPVRLYGPDGEMLGIGEMDGGRLLPRRLFVPSASQGR